MLKHLRQTLPWKKLILRKHFLMKNIKIQALGPIKEADITFGDLTLLVGPQASGKSIFLQMLKLIVDKNDIRNTVEQYNFIWGKSPAESLELFFGEGMQHVWGNSTQIFLDKKEVKKDFFKAKQGDRYKDATESIFYIPAQRIVCIADGRPKFFTEFDESVPYVLRYFSENLRQFLQKDFSKDNGIFPLSQRLKAPLRNSFNESIFHNGKVFIDDASGQRKFRMEVSKSKIPFMTWSAGQKEFMPLLLSFYWLCPSSKISRRDGLKYVIIEEPEMGLHPQAIKSIILQIIDLLSRGYKVIVSTHSPVLLEFAWAFNHLKTSGKGENAMFELFDLKKSAPTGRLFKDVFEKAIKTYYFDRNKDDVTVKDISSLDASDDNPLISEWGGLSSFASKAADIVSKYAQ